MTILQLWFFFHLYCLKKIFYGINENLLEILFQNKRKGNILSRFLARVLRPGRAHRKVVSSWIVTYRSGAFLFSDDVTRVPTSDIFKISVAHKHAQIRPLPGEISLCGRSALKGRRDVASRRVVSGRNIFAISSLDISFHRRDLCTARHIIDSHSGKTDFSLFTVLTIGFFYGGL